MDMDNIECVSTDGMIMMDDDDMINYHNNPFPNNLFSNHQNLSKPHKNNNRVVLGLTPATSVHELLECPVCTNSMYPPIHQVSLSPSP